MHARLQPLALALLLAAGVGLGYALASARANPDSPKADEAVKKRAEVFSHALAKGDYRKVSVVTVEFAPGAEAPKHRHDVAVIGYVLQGSVENQFNEDKPKIHKEGEAWYEAPGTIHTIARNASKTERAKLLVVYVQEEGKAATTLIKEKE